MFLFRNVFLSLLATQLSTAFFLPTLPTLRQVSLGARASDYLPVDCVEAAIIEGVDQNVASHVMATAGEAMAKRTYAVTDFLDPADALACERVLKKVTGVAVDSNGGFGHAVRRRLILARQDTVDEEVIAPFEEVFSALSVSGDFLFQPCTVENFEQAIREVANGQFGLVGDVIIVGERGAQVVIAPELADVLISKLDSIAGIEVKTSIIPIADLCVRELRRKELNSVEASLRLDAIGSAGMGMSRSKVAKMVKSGNGDVLLNGKPVKSASASIKEGDTVTIRGKGLVEIRGIEVTAKGRYRIAMTRVS